MALTQQETQRSLEAAAQVLLAPPNLVSSDQRHAAEALFLEFRKTKSPFLLCRNILESSGSEYVLFEAAGLLQDAVVREWGTESGLQGGEDAEALQTYLLQLVQRMTLPMSVRGRLLQLLAVLVKRASLQDAGEQRSLLLDHLQQLLLHGDEGERGTGNQELACGILQALLEEFGTTLRSADLGLPWEEHLKAKKHFESTGHLQRVFQLCLQMLGEFLSTQKQPSAIILRKLLTLVETVLTWNFISFNSKKLMSMFEASQNPSLRPGVSWKDVFLESNLQQIFFQLRWLARGDGTSLHSWSNSMVQLASLNGAVLATKEDRVRYLASFLQGGFLQLLGGGDLQAEEVLGVAQALRNLVLFFPPQLMSELPLPLLPSFLHHLTTLTCHLIPIAAKEEFGSSEDKVAWDSLERLLEAWTVLASEPTALPPDPLREGAFLVLQEYLRSHLAPPDGTRGVGSPSSYNSSQECGDDEEEVEEAEESDRKRCRDQLQSLGALARLIPQRSLQVLTSLLHKRSRQLQALLHCIALQGMGISISRQLRALQEDLHWLVLVSCWVVAPDQEGETALIPWELLQQEGGEKNQGGGRPTLAFPQLVLQEEEAGEGEEEPGGGGVERDNQERLVLLAGCVLRLAHMDASCWQAGLTPAASPLLSSSLLWFLRKWAAAYLLPAETLYAHLSPPLQSAFGRDTPSAQWTLQFLIGLVSTYLQSASGESDMVEEAVGLLVGLAECKYKKSGVLGSDSLSSLVALQQKALVQAQLGPEGRRGLVRALVAAGAAAPDESSREEFWGQLLQPLLQELLQEICSPSSSKGADLHSPTCRERVLFLLDCLVGVAWGTQSNTATPLFRLALRHALHYAPTLFKAAQNYTDLQVGILEFFCEVAQRTLCHLPTKESQQFCGFCLALMENFQQTHTTTLVLEPGAEEEAYRHILLVLQLATHLLSKDVFDMGCPDTSRMNTSEEDGLSTSRPSEVCVCVLATLLPLLTGELLRFPSLALQYYKLLSLLSEMHPRKVMGAGEGLRNALLGSLQAGLTGFSGDVAALSCEALHSLACCPASSSPEWAVVLQPFLEGLLQPLVGGQLAPEALPAASCALFALLCTLPNSLPALSNAIMRHVRHPSHAQRLNQALNDLLRGVLPLHPPTRPKRIRFRDNFDKFLFVARGILLIK